MRISTRFECGLAVQPASAPAAAPPATPHFPHQKTDNVWKRKASYSRCLFEGYLLLDLTVVDLSLLHARTIKPIR